MKNRYLILVLITTLLVVLVVGSALGKGGPPDDPGPIGGSPGNEDPGQDPTKAVPNLSFPIIATDIIQMFYEQDFVDANADGDWDDGEEWVLALDEYGAPIPLLVDEVITDEYGGSYEGNEGVEHCAYVVDPVTGCATDISGPAGVADGVIDDYDLECVDMEEWLIANESWYDQPVYMDAEYAYDPNLIWNAEYIDASVIGGANSWQADWLFNNTDVLYIDFIDWGNPLENINPIVGQRFPVEVALYEKVADWVNSALTETSLTAYKMACLEWPGTQIELFGTSTIDTSAFTYESAFATVLTNKFTAEVYNPDGTISSIEIAPGIGPSGKMNFASGGGGWIPYMPGWHRIWLHINDPLITFTGAIVNNDEHYIMSTGCKVQELNPNKLELTGIIGDSVYIDVYVVRPSGNE